MLFEKRYDDKEVECGFCRKKVKPIIERNIWDLGGMKPGPLWGSAGDSSAEKPKKFILICPNCKAIIGAK